MKKKIYVAGPYTNGYVIENIKKSIQVGDELLENGFIPFIPHLTGFWDFTIPHPYETWIEYDLEWLKSCDALFRFVGKSSGADKEVLLARELDIPVFYDLYVMMDYFDMGHS